MTDIHDGFRRQGLVRPRNGRVLGGVCAGLGRALRPRGLDGAVAVRARPAHHPGQPAADLSGPVDPHADQQTDPTPDLRRLSPPRSRRWVVRARGNAPQIVAGQLEVDIPGSLSWPAGSDRRAHNRYWPMFQCRTDLPTCSTTSQRRASQARDDRRTTARGARSCGSRRTVPHLRPKMAQGLLDRVDDGLHADHAVLEDEGVDAVLDLAAATGGLPLQVEDIVGEDRISSHCAWGTSLSSWVKTSRAPSLPR